MGSTQSNRDRSKGAGAIVKEAGALAVLPSRKSDQEISKPDFYQPIFLPKIRPKADPNSLF